jgi:hypothetical protein
MQSIAVFNEAQFSRASGVLKTISRTCLAGRQVIPIAERIGIGLIPRLFAGGIKKLSDTFRSV